MDRQVTAEVKIERLFDAKRLNEIVNHPSVYPWVQGALTGELDLTEPLKDPRHVLLMGEHGGVVFVSHQPGIYEAHTQVLPEGRGEWAVAMVRAALEWMFTRTDALEIWTRVPHGNIGSRALAKAIGGRREFTVANGWVKDHKFIPADIFTLKIQDWMRDAPGLVERGHWFHERLTEEYARLGVSEDIHPEDETHDRYVGAAVAMMLGGQPGKAMIFYNRWASMTNYLPMLIAQDKPLLIDIHEAVLAIGKTDFWVVECRKPKLEAPLPAA